MEEGKMYVIKDTCGAETVVFTNHKVPLKDFNILIDAGEYECRVATQEEKEYCYWCYDELGKPAADLKGMEIWRALKSEQ